MAVYKRSYRAYSGRMTPAWSRFLVLTRYVLRSLFRSRWMIAAFVGCLFPPLIYAIVMYLSHSSAVLSLLHVRPGQIMVVNAKFFLAYLGTQSGFAFFLTAFIGPNTIAPDLANGALPLYFCRPFSRLEYVGGKLCALIYLLSLITWVPGLILFGIEANLSGGEWMWNNLWLASATFLGSCIWILVISLIAMALSAWVKWRIAAGALVLGVMFFMSGFGAVVNAVLRSKIGFYISPGALMTRVCAQLFGLESPIEISALSAWVGLLVMCGVCVLLLNKKVRAYEVIR